MESIGIELSDTLPVPQSASYLRYLLSSKWPELSFWRESNYRGGTVAKDRPAQPRGLI